MAGFVVKCKNCGAETDIIVSLMSDILVLSYEGENAIKLKDNWDDAWVSLKCNRCGNELMYQNQS